MIIKKNSQFHKATQTNYTYPHQDSYVTEEYGTSEQNAKGNIVTKRFYSKNKFNEFVFDSIVTEFAKFIDPFTPEATVSRSIFKYNYSDTDYTYSTSENGVSFDEDYCHERFIYNAQKSLLRHTKINCNDDNKDVRYQYDSNGLILKILASYRKCRNNALGYRELHDFTFLFRYD